MSRHLTGYKCRIKNIYGNEYYVRVIGRHSSGMYLVEVTLLNGYLLFKSLITYYTMQNYWLKFEVSK